MPLNGGGGITRRMGETCKRFGKNSGICRIVAGAGIRFFVCVCALSVGHFRRRLCRLKRPAGDAAAFSIDKHIFRTRSGRVFPGGRRFVCAYIVD
ncbi:hypothetical protein DE8669_0682 [Neisseria meningitidis]|uniref:Uncharacterized protein n=2 Tax=Neisseria meningitidis TaxID=487 RepID=I4E769_NEIME|nr:hypothetical protein DE8669_0682 [Neisseria meningitidis]ANW90001.1 hypothetical protein DE10444_1515 [Neisseria meningitidis]CBA05759.1 hypothetical protein predicted by Glimmer/Critica [Neisseria meningitidis alpha153]CCA45187.1 hypothetical protein NMALPHA522_1646 [Neisseria meningitidis alpha522]